MERISFGIDAQYSGKGLWGRDYIIDRPTEFSYSILPHHGNWKQARLWTLSEQRNEPLIPVLTKDRTPSSASFLSIEDDAYELSSMYYEGQDLYIRLFNAQGDSTVKEISVAGNNPVIKSVELDGRIVEILPVQEKDGRSFLKLSIPQFGIRTLKVERDEK